MTWHVFITTPAAGMPFAVSPYTVECKEVYATQAAAQAFADAKTLNPGVVALFDTMPSVHAPWAAGQAISTGEMRAYNEQTWRCIQGHTTQTGWEPPNVQALWTMVPKPGVTAWQWPVAYSMPSRSTYGDRLYQLIQAHTSQEAWNPPAVPALWQDIGAATGTTAYTRARWWVVDSLEPDYTAVERAVEV